MVASNQHMPLIQRYWGFLLKVSCTDKLVTALFDENVIVVTTGTTYYMCQERQLFLPYVT